MIKRARYIGEDKTVECWLNGNICNDIEIKSGQIFLVGLWNKFDEVESVMTFEREWICDLDSEGFKKDFEICTTVGC